MAGAWDWPDPALTLIHPMTFDAEARSRGEKQKKFGSRRGAEAQRGGFCGEAAFSIYGSINRVDGMRRGLTAHLDSSAPLRLCASHFLLSFILTPREAA